MGNRSVPPVLVPLTFPKMAKAMKAMKAMGAMKKKTVSKIATGRLAKVMVFRGSKGKTVGGLTAKDLTKNKHGKVVSKKLSAKIKGFVAMKKGTPFYIKAKEFYNA